MPPSSGSHDRPAARFHGTRICHESSSRRDYEVTLSLARFAKVRIMATMNISLPDELKSFIDAQVAEHGYGSTSEYLRDLIRRQRDVAQLRGQLLDGANSGSGKKIDDAYFAQLRKQADRPVT